MTMKEARISLQRAKRDSIDIIHGLDLLQSPENSKNSPETTFTYTKSGSSIYLKDFSDRLLFDYQKDANELPRDRRGGIREGVEFDDFDEEESKS